ncbi:MAG: prolyl oligopeptidase family serine peptidase [Thermoguttaceae bacterium]
MKIYCLAALAIVLMIALLGTAAAARAQSVPIDKFQALTHEDNDGGKLLYRLLTPANSGADKKHPLLIFLHGAGERGNDNKAQLKWGAKFMLAAAEKHGCYVVVPQCPTGKKWAEVDWSQQTHVMPKEPSESIRLLMEVIAGMQKKLSIDTERLYIMGLSMGGYGTWDTIQRYPDMFAAAVPICGGGDETGADRIKTPVWAFHGDKDGAVPVERSRKMIAAIRANGGEPKYTEYPGCGHNAWSPAMADPELPKWLFSK